MTTEIRHPGLDDLADRIAIRAEFYDPAGTRHGLPTFPFHYAPDGLATRRQLRADGLRPNGQPIAAQILWRHRKHIRTAYLYRRDLAAPKRTASPAQLAAIGKALLARRTCRNCGTTRGYYIPRRTGACLICEPGR
ncbi:RRQRL motif-containing zinc-binding protein [Krasilnikovia sp. MM14-A1004]|uniref:RRQRL motif-containing zinc-binding protein n=1 Tax=Krasilnikovia sp. MM14-A1004 TaxID=3373541 RepID=UPI00399CBE2B